MSVYTVISLLRQNPSLEKEIKYLFETSIYTMDHPDLTVSNFMEKSISLQRVKI